MYLSAMCHIDIWIANIIHIGVGFCVARPMMMGNAKAFELWDE